MQNFLLIFHLILAIAIIGVVLLQRTEGGALGIGGGDGLQTGRTPSNPLVRLTAILGICFFISSMALTLLARGGSLLDDAPQTQQPLTVPKPDPQLDQNTKEKTNDGEAQ